MHTGEPALIGYIRAVIREQSPMPFSWFMEQALYHPEHGYYSSGRAAIGRRGDYFTNVSVGPLFGKLIAAQFEEMWEALGRPDDFFIVEQGAHHGDFARDVLEALRKDAPDFFGTVRYLIIESFVVLRKRQAETLTEFSEKIDWRPSVAELEPFSGVQFSNELLDAMPVHLISRKCGQRLSPPTEWAEKYVDETSDGFAFVEGEISSAKLQNQLTKIPAPPECEYQTEVNIAALDWIEELSAKLTRGYVLSVDYGYARGDYYAPHRTSGTLAGFSQHRRAPSPLQNVGQIDITAHVEWTSFVESGEERGLRLAGFTDQHHFITGLLASEMLRDLNETASASTRRALQTLLHPNLLGMTFQFLALVKGVDPAAGLSGFRFARDGRAALGLGAAVEGMTSFARRSESAAV
jgi:SAM-dependent MidA family methyltransferase